MSTVLTPPPAPAAPGPEPAPSGGPSMASRVVAILAMVLGAVVIIGTVGTSIYSAVGAASVGTDVRTLSVTGVDELDVDLDAGSIRVEFADIDEAELTVTSSFAAGRWTFEKDGGTLAVSSPRWMWGMGWMQRDEAILRLPSSLAGMDAELDLAAGDAIVDGSFTDLAVRLGAGQVRVTGDAEQFAMDVSAGSGRFDLADVEQATLTVSAGSVEGAFTGSQPDAVGIDVSAGGLRLTVPDGEYDITSDVSAGSFEDRIRSTAGAASTIEVDVSAGQVVLRAD
ncbi:DUF4097 family beta strand repeat-containing protein [Microbacterium aureliae]